MYINFKLLKEKGLSVQELFTLQIIKQLKTEPERVDDLAMTLTDDFIEDMSKRSLITKIKGKKKDLELSKYRLSSKGSKLLEDLQTPLVTEADIIVFEWLRDLYLKSDKEIGSESKCRKLIAWFRSESGIDKNRLITLCKKFTDDEDRMEYSKVLQFVFWKPENHFQTSPKLEDSKLWLYYEKYREEFDKIFEKL